LNIERIVEELEQERDRISQAITLLKGVNSPGSARKIATANGESGRQRSAQWNEHGYQKATVRDDEEALGRETKEGEILL
jgi:hypothetical protein